MNQEHTAAAPSGHITVKNYIVGFVLALVLTIVSFGLAMLGALPKNWLFVGITVAALLQMFVHMRYFLHLDWSKEKRWNVVTLGFTAILLLIFIGGTVWVMYTLNSRMM